MSAPAWSSRREFARELERPEEELNLARAALLVAREEYPQLPMDRYLMRLDVLAEETRDRLGSESAPPVVLAEAIRHLFVVRKLRGNRDHYHDPRNSLLNDVLDRGLGIPLTLAVVLLEVGWRLGLPMLARLGLGRPLHSPPRDHPYRLPTDAPRSGESGP